jgi:hypothetical protein
VPRRLQRRQRQHTLQRPSHPTALATVGHRPVGTSPTKVPSDNLGRIRKTGNADYNSLCPIVLGNRKRCFYPLTTSDECVLAFNFVGDVSRGTSPPVRANHQVHRGVHLPLPRPTQQLNLSTHGDGPWHLRRH